MATILTCRCTICSKFSGVGDALQTFDFVPQDQEIPGTTLPLAVNSENINADTSITTVYVKNVRVSL